MFWSEIGSGFGEPGGTLLPKIPRNTPPPPRELQQVEDINYLGIALTSKLKWDQHVSTVSSKAFKVLGVVQRKLYNCPRLVRETAYKTLV